MCSKNEKKASWKMRNVMPGEKLNNVVYNYKRRIYFSKLGMDGLEDMHEYSKMPIFYQYLEGREPCKSIDETRDYLNILMDRVKNGYHGGESMYWFIRLKSTNKVIGTFGLVGVDFDKKVTEFGKGLSPDFWGLGLMFEALWVISNYCFEDLGIDKIITSTHCDNHPNIQLMKAIGSNVEREVSVLAPNGRKVRSVRLTLKKAEAKLSRCLAFAKMGES